VVGRLGLDRADRGEPRELAIDACDLHRIGGWWHARTQVCGIGAALGPAELADELVDTRCEARRRCEDLDRGDQLALPLREAREQFERAYLQQQLLLCNGKVGQLAKRVGMERTHLYRKLRSLGVDFRNVSED